MTLRLPVTAASPDVARDPPAAHAPSPAASVCRLTWVPIRSLTSRHRSRIQTHLLGLDERDRYLRFGSHASDAQIARYTDSLDFERDEVFGIFNRRLDLVAMAHLAYEPAVKLTARGAMAEFGVSVGAKARGRGYGARLFDHAVLHARNRGFDTLFIQALSENMAMLKIARRAGAKVERSGSETEAWLTLPPDTFVSQVGAAVDQQAAEWDYRMKQHARRVHQVLDGVAEVQEQMAHAPRNIE
jgi:RimJ/RimL family protein N-acetyltransferase